MNSVCTPGIPLFLIELGKRLKDFQIKMFSKSRNNYLMSHLNENRQKFCTGLKQQGF